MAWNPFKKLEKLETESGAVDSALEELSKEERIESNIQTLQSQLNNNPDLFEGREDEAIKVLVGIKAENVGKMLDKLTEMKEKRHGLEDETREMPAIKISEGLEELLKAKHDFENIGGDFDDLAGFMGAVRQLAQKENYLSDPDFVQKISNSVETIGDAVSGWQNESEKRELERKYSRLVKTLPDQVKKQVMEKVA